MSLVPVAIVGGGPYGLSASAHLSARGVEHRIVGRPMSSWAEHMPAGMFLKSEGCASSIDVPDPAWTLEAFCERAGLPYADFGLPVPIATFLAYGRALQRALVPHLDDDEVVELARDGGGAGGRAGYRLRLGSGEELRAHRVVLAVGLTHFAEVPAMLRALPRDRLSHTSEHTGFDALRGRRVAVIGAGQSALESAALLHEAGAQPEVFSRRANIMWNPEPALAGYVRERGRPHLRPTPLGGGWRLWTYWQAMPIYPSLPASVRLRHVARTLGPAGAWWLRPRVEGVVPVHAGHQLVAARAVGDMVVLRVVGGGSVRDVEVDHVLAATGYRVELSRLRFLAPALRGSVRTLTGAPVLSRAFETTAPGLYAIGLVAAQTYGPAMRFVAGTELAGPRLARHLARRTAPRASLRAA